DLNNRRAMLKGGGRTVELVGVGDPHGGRGDYPAVAGPASPDADAHLARSHTREPAALDAMAADGFELSIAGHTPGEPVRVPGFRWSWSASMHRTSAGTTTRRWPAPPTRTPTRTWPSPTRPSRPCSTPWPPTASSC